MGSTSPALDFVVIGAQKGGTTTLFEHLRHHPGLCLPADKEAPFFNRPELYSRGVDHLCQSCNRSSFEEASKREFDREGLPNSGEYLGGQE